MRKRTRRSVVLLAIAILWTPTRVLAQAEQAVDYPSDDVYEPITCAGLNSWDPIDQGNIDDPEDPLRMIDIIGTEDEPAIAIYNDDSFLFLRMRIGDDPRLLVIPTDYYEVHGWGFLFDTDGDHDGYELSTTLDGTGGAEADPDTFDISRNTVQAQPGDPSDPAEDVLRSFPYINEREKSRRFNTRVTKAASRIGDRSNFYMNFAIPLLDMYEVGADLDQPISFWAGTSLEGVGLTGDMACHDGTTGTPTLAETVFDSIVADPADPHLSIGGGLACSAAPAGRARACPGWALLLALGAFLLRRRA